MASILLCSTMNGIQVWLVFCFTEELCVLLLKLFCALCSLGVIGASKDTRSEKWLLLLPSLGKTMWHGATQVRITSALCWYSRGTCHPWQLHHAKTSNRWLLSTALFRRWLFLALPERMKVRHMPNRSRGSLSRLSPRGRDDPKTLQADLHREAVSGLLEMIAEQGNSTFSADAKGSSTEQGSCWEEATLQQWSRVSLALPLSSLAFYTTFCLSLKKLCRDMLPTEHPWEVREDCVMLESINSCINHKPGQSR